jgi:hypothetical protein
VGNIFQPHCVSYGHVSLRQLSDSLRRPGIVPRRKSTCTERPLLHSLPLVLPFSVFAFVSYFELRISDFPFNQEAPVVCKPEKQPFVDQLPLPADAPHRACRRGRPNDAAGGTKKNGSPPNLGTLVVQASRLPKMWWQKQQARRLHHKGGGEPEELHASRNPIGQAGSVCGLLDAGAKVGQVLGARFLGEEDLAVLRQQFGEL